jgi:hypothetical protein
MVVEAPPTTAPSTAPPRPAPRHRPPTPAAEFRTALLDALPGQGLTGVLPVLHGRAPVPDGGVVDELTGLAHLLVRAPGATDTDHLLLATALYLRSRVDGGGWDTDDGTDDVTQAGESLLRAAPALSTGPADLIGMAVRLATALEELRPGCTAAQVLALVGRRRRPVAEAVVFVANPRGDRKHDTLDAMVLRRTFYPDSVGLGETAEKADGTGTPEEVLARLDASLLHLGCGVTADGGLELAGGVLDAHAIVAHEHAATGGLAILPPAAAGTAELTDALLATRFSGVIGFRAPVPEPAASLLYFLLHSQLVDERRDPASAVAAVRRWSADPHRELPEHLPPWYAADAASADLEASAEALVHHGL